MLLIDLLPVIAVCYGSLLLARRLLHYFQLESYQFRGFFKTLLRQLDRALLPGLVFGGVSFALLCGLFPVSAHAAPASLWERLFWNAEPRSE